MRGLRTGLIYAAALWTVLLVLAACLWEFDPEVAAVIGFVVLAVAMVAAGVFILMVAANREDK